MSEILSSIFIFLSPQILTLPIEIFAMILHQIKHQDGLQILSEHYILI